MIMLCSRCGGYVCTCGDDVEDWDDVQVWLCESCMWDMGYIFTLEDSPIELFHDFNLFSEEEDN